MTTDRTAAHLTEALNTIARWYPATAQPPRTATSQTRLAYGSRTPIAADVISLRRTCVDTLTTWALLIADERDLKPQVPAGHVLALTGFLGTHAGWLAEHDAGSDALREISHVARQIEDVARQRRPARVRIAPCPEITEDGVHCIGRLVATVRRDDDLLPSIIRCDVDRLHAWSPEDWRALGRRVAPPMHPEAVQRLVNTLGESA